MIIKGTGTPRVSILIPFKCKSIEARSEVIRCARSDFRTCQDSGLS